MTNWLRAAFLLFPILAISSADCTYLDKPEEFLRSPDEYWQDISGSTTQVAALKESSPLRRGVVSDALAIPRNNFIDEYIFGRMDRDGIPPAPLADDQEFLRRVYLDLTGRIPSVEQYRSFLSDTNPAKRDALIDSLIGTEEFVNKWTLFFGDLFKNDGPSTNVNRYLQGRDAFYAYLRDSISRNKPYDRMAQEIIAATGDTFENGAANWIVGGTVPMGPVQDTYDGQAVNLSQMFLGINAVDCLLCHDGARHLDNVNLWGKEQKRADMQGLSAFFARTRMVREVISQDPVLAKYMISDDVLLGDYLLNTRIGNRTPRDAEEDELNLVDPRYPFATENYGTAKYRREALARSVTGDPQFARAAVNYIWEKLMVAALVSPSNGFDLARLDPDNPPPAPWTLQPTNPELLQTLSRWFRDNNYDLKQLIALISKSNAYQLSSSYPGTWSPAYVPYYARKFARRLDAEEIHDAVVKATGVIPRYTLDYAGAMQPLPAVNWALQLPDTREPRSNGQAVQFLNAFGRGDRDQNPRNSGGSPLQALNMMNQPFVTSRIHANDDGSHVQRLLGATSDSTVIIEELYLATLSRRPSPREMTVASEAMSQLGTRRGAESLQWALLNKLEFLFSY